MNPSISIHVPTEVPAPVATPVYATTTTTMPPSPSAAAHCGTSVFMMLDLATKTVLQNDIYAKEHLELLDDEKDLVQKLQRYGVRVTRDDVRTHAEWKRTLPYPELPLISAAHECELLYAPLPEDHVPLCINGPSCVACTSTFPNATTRPLPNPRTPLVQYLMPHELKAIQDGTTPLVRRKCLLCLRQQVSCLIRFLYRHTESLHVAPNAVLQWCRHSPGEYKDCLTFTSTDPWIGFFQPMMLVYNRGLTWDFNETRKRWFVNQRAFIR